MELDFSIENGSWRRVLTTEYRCIIMKKVIESEIEHRERWIEVLYSCSRTRWASKVWSHTGQSRLHFFSLVLLFTYSWHKLAPWIGREGRGACTHHPWWCGKPPNVPVDNRKTRYDAGQGPPKGKNRSEMTKSGFSRSYLDHLLNNSELDVTLNAKDISEDIEAQLVIVVVVVDDFIEELWGVGDRTMDLRHTTSVSSPSAGSLYIPKWVRICWNRRERETSRKKGRKRGLIRFGWLGQIRKSRCFLPSQRYARSNEYLERKQQPRRAREVRRRP